MKNKKLVSFILVLLLMSISCNVFTPKSPDVGVVPPGDISKVFDNLPTYDPNAPLPSPGAAALRALTVFDPGVAVLESDVEASERAAIQAILSDLQIQLGAGNGAEIASRVARSGGVKRLSPAMGASFPAASDLSGGLNGPGGVLAFDAMFASVLVSQVSDYLAVGEASNENKSAPGSEGGATTKSGLQFRKNPDGSTTLELANHTDAAKNGVSANTNGKVSLEGWRCPNAAGQVSFTMKLTFSAESEGASYTVDLTAFVRAEVDDNAKLISTTSDVTQGTRKVQNGKNVYVESGATYGPAGTTNQRQIRSSQDATSSDVSDLSAAGEQAANFMALGALLFAESNWQKGGCTKIEASSPGTVEPGSTTAIPVTVHHRVDGSEVSAKLAAVLAGDKSVEPSSLAATPGTLTYTAPAESGKQATITLTATSRRGRATLDLTASTGNPSYRVNDAKTAGMSWVTQCIPALDQPYQVSWKSPQGTADFHLSPDSWQSGTAEVTLTNTLAGVTVTQTGQGPFSVTVLSQSPGGSPLELSIDIKAKGTITQCAAGRCTTVNDVEIDQSIPIIVSDSSCK